MPTKTLWFLDVIARSIAPLVGVLLLGWDARNVLVLYCVDTVLSMLVIFAGLAGAFLPGGHEARRVQFARGAGVIIPVTIVIVAATLPFVVGRAFPWRSTIDDPSLRVGILWQAIAALWSCRDLIRALRDSTPEKLKLERRFGLVLSRWLTTAFLAIVIPDDWLAPYGSVALVAIYVALSIGMEAAPQLFYAGMGEAPEDEPARPPTRESRSDRRRRGKTTSRPRDDGPPRGE